MAVQVAEIVYRYDTECVPVSYKNNMVAYIKDSSTPKLCSFSLKVCLSFVLSNIFRFCIGHVPLSIFFVLRQLM